MFDRERVTTAFDAVFSRGDQTGASLCIYADGQEVLSLSAGVTARGGSTPWTDDTAVLVWSANKGPSAACLLHAMESHGIQPDRKVTTLWPEFAAEGKSEIRISDVLSHQAGLAAFPASVPATDHAEVARSLASMAPAWELGTGHGYHPRTSTYLWDELIRRITGGTTLSEYWRRAFAEPLGLDFWFGVPEHAMDRVAEITAARNPKAPADEVPLYTALRDVTSLQYAALRLAAEVPTIRAMNAPEIRSATLPAFSGIGTARSLARFYSMLAGGGSADGNTFFSPGNAILHQQSLVDGPDRVLLLPTAFSHGFFKDPVAASGDKLRRLLGPSTNAFGHPGAGGSLAFADPDNRIAFAFVVGQMELGIVPGPRARSLVEALYSTLQA